MSASGERSQSQISTTARLGAAALGVAIGLAGGDAKAGMFDPTTFTLDNGMEVVVIENHRAPVVSHWVWYRVGTADSPPGKSGLPHFLEHLMFKGTETIPPGEFSKIVAKNGGRDNAVTSLDYTAYFQTIAKDRLAMVMEMEADRMVNLVLSDEHVLPERDVVIEERRQRVDNNPGALLNEQMGAAQYLHHPYGAPVIGWMHEMETYSREDAIAFYERHYAPNNAILVVAGDVDPEEVRALASETYGAIEARPVVERSRVAEPPHLAARRIEFADPRVRQPSLIRSYLAPSIPSASGDDPNPYALEVLAEILGGGGVSRLQKALLIEEGSVAGIGAYYRGVSLDPTQFRIYATPRAGVTLEQVEAGVDRVIAELLEEGVSEDELRKAIRRMRADAIYATDSLSTAARLFGAGMASGLSAQEIDAWPERIARVTVEEVEAAARAVLDPRRSVTGWLVAEAETP